MHVGYRDYSGNVLEAGSSTNANSHDPVVLHALSANGGYCRQGNINDDNNQKTCMLSSSR